MAEPGPSTPGDLADLSETNSVTKDNADSSSSSTSNQTSSTILADKFAAACARTPCPSFFPAELPSATKEELRFLSQNAAGEILISTETVNNCTPENRNVVTGAIRKAFQHVASQHGLCVDSQARKKTYRQSSQLPFAELVKDDRASFSPMPSLSSFSWNTSKSAAVLDEVIREIQSEAALKGINSKEAAVESISTHTVSHPSNSVAGSRPSEAGSDSDPPALDLVILAAQEEAVASVVLKEIRATHGRMRKSSSSFSNGQTPVWALLAQRGGKLKPEAAAEMARARVAAATAAAVMRDALEAESREQSQSSPSTSHSQQHRLSAPRILSDLDDLSDYADHDHDFLHERASPRTPSKTSNSKSRLSSLKFPPRPLSMTDATPRSRASDKKRVSFVEGTIFHTKK